MFYEKERRVWDFEKFADSIALIDENGSVLTYTEVMTTSDAIAANIEKRSVVVILCQNSMGSVLGYAGFLNNGVVPLLVNANLDKELLKNLLNTYKPAYLWLPEEKAAEFSTYQKVFTKFGYALLKTDSKAYPVYDGLALLLTTSGSTGSPKFVRQSYENITTNTAQIVEYLKLENSNARAVTALPMNYTYGLSVINTHLATGQTLLLSDKSIMQREFWDFFKKEKATSFAGVPYTYEMLNILRFWRMKLPSLKVMTQAGGKLSPALHEKFAKFAGENSIEFFVMYGGCEATARMGYLPPRFAISKKGSMGVAIPGGKFSIIDNAGNIAKNPHEKGELVYEGKNVALGYAENAEDLKKGDEWHGRLLTGDIAEFDEDGFYYIVGRKKRFLKVYGNRVNLDEIDAIVKDEFKTEAVSAGKDDNVYIIITDGTLKDQIHAFISKKTKLNASAFKVVVVDEIPKNDSGKIRYEELKKYFAY